MSNEKPPIPKFEDAFKTLPDNLKCTAEELATVRIQYLQAENGLNFGKDEDAFSFFKNYSALQLIGYKDHEVSSAMLSSESFDKLPKDTKKVFQGGSRSDSVYGQRELRAELGAFTPIINKAPARRDELNKLREHCGQPIS